MECIEKSLAHKECAKMLLSDGDVDSIDERPTWKG